MNDTWYPGQTIRASQDENNFGPSWTNYRVLLGLCWVQNGSLMTHLSLDVENLRKTLSEVDDTWYPGQTIIASQNERNLNQVGPIIGSSVAYLWSKIGHFCLICP